MAKADSASGSSGARFPLLGREAGTGRLTPRARPLEKWMPWHFGATRSGRGKQEGQGSGAENGERLLSHRATLAPSRCRRDRRDAPPPDPARLVTDLPEVTPSGPGRRQAAARPSCRAGGGADVPKEISDAYRRGTRSPA